MEYGIFPPSAPIKGKVRLPSSKSISNRVLMIRALSRNTFPIGNLSDSDDTRIMIRVLQENPETVHVGHAGTAMRFLTAYYAAMGVPCVITGSDRMLNRPIGSLVQALNDLGAGISYVNKPGFPPVRTSGNPLQGGILRIGANVSSQFISALLLIAPALQGGLTLHLEGDIVSASYIRMTLALMRVFGINASFEKACIRIIPGTYHQVPYTVESDWSAASYWYTLVALLPGSEIFLEGLSEERLQGDALVADFFARLGVKSHYEAGGVQLSHQGTRCRFFEENFLECPDIVQTLVVALCLLNIPFRISGAETLRIKETDRIAALQTELLAMGYPVTETAPGILEWNGERKKAAEHLRIATYQDHRMAMAFAPASVYFPGLTICDPGVVSKSYPGYWKDLSQSGFEVRL